MEAWKGRIEILVQAAGLAIFVQFIGGIVLYIRLDQEQIPPAETVSRLPKELLFVYGARTVLPLAALGLIGALLTYALVQPSDSTEADDEAESEPEPRWRVERDDPSSGAPATDRLRIYETAGESDSANPSGSPPVRFGWVLVLLGAGAFAAGLVIVHWLLAFALAVALVLVVLGLAWTTTGVAAAARVVFISLVIFGGALALLAEVGASVKLDVVALQLKDGTRLSGFMVTRTGDEVFVVVRSRAPRSDPRKRDIGRQVIPVPEAEVKRLAYGPTGVSVNKPGFDRAERFSQVLDAASPELTVDVAENQSLRRGHVFLTVQCDEGCALTVTGRLVFVKRKGRRNLETVTSELRRSGTTRVKLRPPPGAASRRARVRALVLVVRAVDPSDNVSTVRRTVAVRP